MSQVTIYLDEDTAKQARAAARSERLSLSKWIGKLIQQRTQSEWPDGFRALAGAWKELPTADELRDAEGTDVRRERLE